MERHHAKKPYFMNQLHEELFSVPTGAVVFSDNQGALFLVKKRQVSQRSNQADRHLTALCLRNAKAEETR